VVDPGADSRRQAVTLGAAGVFADVDQLPLVDGIVVATPATTHAAVLEAVLDRAIPVFCEKPFTTDLESARRLTAQAGDRLFVMHVWRYHHAIEKMASLARSEELGPVELVRTTRTNWTSPRRDIDYIWTLVPHDLSIALEILGSLPPVRASWGEWRGPEPVGMIGFLEGDARFVFEVSTRYPDKRREVRLHCRNGVAVLPSGKASVLEIVRDAAGPPQVERFLLPDEPPLRRELQAFLDYLNGGPPPRSSAAESLQIMAALVELRRRAGLDAIPRGMST